jgi:uncharacterized protein (UPF0147 family)
MLFCLKFISKKYPNKVSDFLKKLKGVFVVDDGTTPTNTTSTTTAQATTAQATPTQQPSQNAANVGSINGTLNEKFMDILMGAIEKNNQEGFDYFEFKQSLRNLSKMSLDESTRYQSAYAMAQTMGATPAKLIESCKFYINVLSSEQTKFNEAHTQQRSRLIGTREEEVKNHENMIQQKAEQIQQLNQQIEEHKQKSQQIRNEVSESTVKIENTKADFDVTFNNVVGQLQEDISKMQNYLK